MNDLTNYQLALICILAVAVILLIGFVAWTALYIVRVRRESYESFMEIRQRRRRLQTSAKADAFPWPWPIED